MFCTNLYFIFNGHILLLQGQILPDFKDNNTVSSARPVADFHGIELASFTVIDT